MCSSRVESLFFNAARKKDRGKEDSGVGARTSGSDSLLFTVGGEETVPIKGQTRTMDLDSHVHAESVTGGILKGWKNQEVSGWICDTERDVPLGQQDGMAGKSACCQD